MKPIDKLKIMLSYIGILIAIPALTMREDDFAEFHIKQGINLLLVEMIVHTAIRIVRFFIFGFIGIIPRMFGYMALSTLFGIIFGFITFAFYVACIILTIIGCNNVWYEKKRELPVIGKVKIIR